VYDTNKEAQVRAQVLRKRDPNFHVYVGQVGYWLPYDPDADDIDVQEYQESHLNELMKGYKQNRDQIDSVYEKTVAAQKMEAVKKNEEKKAKQKETTHTSQESTQQSTQQIQQPPATETLEKITELRKIADDKDRIMQSIINSKQTETENGNNDNNNNDNITSSVIDSTGLGTNTADNSLPDLGDANTNIDTTTKTAANAALMETEDPWLARKKENMTNPKAITTKTSKPDTPAINVDDLLTKIL
jgi:hypothetical protein